MQPAERHHYSEDEYLELERRAETGSELVFGPCPPLGLRKAHLPVGALTAPATWRPRRELPGLRSMEIMKEGREIASRSAHDSRQNDYCSRPSTRRSSSSG